MALAKQKDDIDRLEILYAQKRILEDEIANIALTNTNEIEKELTDIIRGKLCPDFDGKWKVENYSDGSTLPFLHFSKLRKI